MSKKGLFSNLRQDADASATGNEFSPPRLFSRRFSRGQPFVISDTDSPYDKRTFSTDPNSIYSGLTGRKKRTDPVVGLGIFPAGSRRSSRRNRRALAVGLFVAAVLLWQYARAVPKYLPAVPSALPIPSWSGAFSPSTLINSQGATDDGQHGLHTFHPNGLLLVNPHGRHPIHVLIDNAEKTWRNLVKKQSKTLEEAVREYKRRYRRNPPKGFDAWWQFAQANDVVLVDEYDQIARDFEAFHALEPRDLRHRDKVMQDREHTFVLAIGDGVVSRHGEHAELQRAKDMAALLSQFANLVPDAVNMTFVIDDNPAVMLGHGQRERMLELAKQGEFWGPGEFAEPEPAELSNFAKACPPGSKLRRAEEGGTVSVSESGRSFVHDHPRSMDLCSHPEYRRLHGATSQGGIPLTPLVPLFTWAKTSVHDDILVTPLEQYDDDYLVYDPPFEEKVNNKLMWRGSTTGSEFRHGYEWEKSQRARLHFMAQEKEGVREVMWSDNGSMRMDNLTARELNRAYMDARFSGVPAQCDPDICDKMRKIINFAPTMGLEDQNTYRYLMDVDGNGWSGRFHRLLSTNAVVLKSTVFPEWYAERIVPWVHYVPVKVDYSDLYDIMAFFVGKPDGIGAHTEMAKKIGEQGKEFAKKHWRRVDMAAYMFRVALEYSRLIHRETGVETDYWPAEF